MVDSPELTRVSQLLHELLGPQQAEMTLNRLLRSDEPIAGIVRDVVASPSLEHLYRKLRTLGIQSGTRKEADPAIVGITDLDASLPFEEQFSRSFVPLLKARAEGFATIFRSLPGPPHKLLMIETGCMRIPGNWAGDGQSTFMFDALARERDGHVFSIDVTLESIDTARRACSSATHLLLGDSVATLHALGALIKRPADLLYLDSYDLDPRNPMPSAIHHAMELIAAQPLVGPNTIVCVDDYSVGATTGGKGLVLDQYFSRIRARVLYSGYQKVWQLT
jgi:hypothetical protein